MGEYLNLLQIFVSLSLLCACEFISGLWVGALSRFLCACSHVEGPCLGAQLELNPRTIVTYERLKTTRNLHGRVFKSSSNLRLSLSLSVVCMSVHKWPMGWRPIKVSVCLLSRWRNVPRNWFGIKSPNQWNLKKVYKTRLVPCMGGSNIQMLTSSLSIGPEPLELIKD